MAKFRFGIRRLAALTLTAGLAPAAAADAPSVATMLHDSYKPTQPGIEVTTPPAAEFGSCKVDLERGKPLANNKVPTAWVLKDGQGRVLRKFLDTTGDGPVNALAFYKDGEEVYREIDTNGNRKMDQYRWVGPNGSKWGSDPDENGKIDSWIAISPEELSQEVLAAVLTKDQRRLEALLMTKADIETLGLPGAEAKRIEAKVAAAPAQFQKTVQELGKLPANTLWVHLEIKVPQATPADTIEARQDLVRYRSAAILYQEGEGKDAKHNWLQAGELIQVGKAWKLIQAPTPGMEAPPDPRTDDRAGALTIPAGGDELVKQLNAHDQKGPSKPGRQGIIEFNLTRAAVLIKIAQLYKPEERSKQEVWIRQVADSYAAAAQQGDASALKSLGEWRAWAKDSSGGLLPYIHYREMTAEYAQKLADVGANQDKLTKLQEDWKQKLTGFIADHPKADDTPDAMMQLGMVNEFFGSRSEKDAKEAYAKLVQTFPGHALARKAQGCLDRLQLEGSPINLTGPTLNGGAPFNITSHRGKAVVVYYWASWNDLATTDFAKIELAMKAYPGKVELVCVNLDNAAAEALAFLKAHPVKAPQLFLPGGLESPLAVQYGITALPVMFLVGPDGKVVTRHAAATTLDEELKKLFKESDDKKDK